MVKLEKLQLAGFKSFSDRTEVSFPPGITAVVGPNGCGKSNIGDAINWVLGEQSARMLRGSSMQDVIFSGSEARRPVGLAEVSLHLSGVNGTPDGQQREVVITRRLFRSGESEYLVNGSRARLKDIQDLLREAHVGAKTYATIEQGRIDQILNARPKERRAILEDAAGISGFKQKRHLAELKLEATTANLLRVGDVIAEVQRQIGALKRQAARARRYARLRDELRAQERVRFAHRAHVLDAELARRRAEEHAAREHFERTHADRQACERQVDEGRHALEAAERTVREGEGALHALRLSVEREEARLASLGERIETSLAAGRSLAETAEELGGRARQLDEEARALDEAVAGAARDRRAAQDEAHAREVAVEEALRALAELRDAVEGWRKAVVVSVHERAERRNAVQAIGEACGRAVRQLERLQAERGAAQGDLDRLEGEARTLAEQAAACTARLEETEAAELAAETALGQARARHTDAMATLAAAREREGAAQDRLRTLEDVATRFAGVSDGVRILLTAGGERGIRARGVLADAVTAAPEVEAAADRYLADLLPTVVVESAEDARRAAELLREQGAGRTTLLCRDEPVGAPAVGVRAAGPTALPAAILADPRVAGSLRAALAVDPAVNGLLEQRLGEALVVDTLETALSLHREWPHVDYVTASGDVVYASGVIASGGAPAGDGGLLAHTRRIHEARTELSAAGDRAGAALVDSLARAGELAHAEAAVREARGALDAARHRAMEVRAHVERTDQDRERTGRRSRVLTEEIATTDAERLRLQEELAAATAASAAAEGEATRAEAQLACGSAALQEAESGARARAEELAGARAELAARVERLGAAERDRGRARAALAEVEQRHVRTNVEIEATRAREAEARDLLARTEAELLALRAEREQQAGALAGAEAALLGLRASLGDAETALRALRAENDSAREAVQDAELAAQRVGSDRSHLDELCMHELGGTAAGAIEAARAAGCDLDAVDLVAVEAEIARIRAGVEEIGPVNMTAIEEFGALEERHRFLAAQRQDLEAAVESLRETIRRINRSSRERFVEAFEAIRASYQEVFRTLFGGGRADLRLEEGEDVLECGVEILAQPPGKRLGSVSLLSGGEKAMAAIALLFAIFRYQPSPFCLLDEVDAALDDLNVGRFTRMLREYAGQTQFVLITHNKRSMESASVLYGVTMEEPGVSKLVSLSLD